MLLERNSGNRTVYFLSRVGRPLFRVFKVLAVDGNIEEGKHPVSMIYSSVELCERQ
jgi:hypothetical protein